MKEEKEEPLAQYLIKISENLKILISGVNS